MSNFRPLMPRAGPVKLEALAAEQEQKDYMARGKPKFPWQLHQFAGGSVNLFELTVAELKELQAKCGAWNAVNVRAPFMTQQPNLELINDNTTDAGG